MLLKPLSKSTKSNFDICPRRAWEFKCNGAEPIFSQPAANGQEVHGLWGRALLGEDASTVATSASNHEVSDLFYRALLATPTRKSVTSTFEQYITADRSGVLCALDDAWVHGYLDRIDHDVWENTAYVDDLKTGKFEKDDRDERHIYAGILTKALYPDIERVVFTRIFARSGNCPAWIYAWERGRLVVTGPLGDIEVFASHADNPLVPLYLEVILQQIDQTEPNPRPGRHCISMYGQACQFLGAECPGGLDLPQILKPTLPTQRNLGTAFLEIGRTAKTDITSVRPEVAADALAAVLQLKAATKNVEEKIKTWANENGDIVVDGDTYGWRETTKAEVDKSKVLDTLLGLGFAPSQIADIINISFTSLSRLSKRRYGDVRDLLLTSAVTEQPGSPSFGKIKEDQNDQHK